MNIEEFARLSELIVENNALRAELKELKRPKACPECESPYDYEYCFCDEPDANGKFYCNETGQFYGA